MDASDNLLGEHLRQRVRKKLSKYRAKCALPYPTMPKIQVLRATASKVRCFHVTRKEMYRTLLARCEYRVCSHWLYISDYSGGCNCKVRDFHVTPFLSLPELLPFRVTTQVDFH